MDPFEAILRAHRLPAPTEVNVPTASTTDDARLRADAEANPLDGIESIARLRTLELQEGRANAAQAPRAWFNQPLDELGTKVWTSVVGAARDAWNIKARTPESIAYELVRIAGEGERPLYLILFSILVLLLFKARARTD
jgi:hypothetical protein